jgi:hypothetical protein
LKEPIQQLIKETLSAHCMGFLWGGGGMVYALGRQPSPSR